MTTLQKMDTTIKNIVTGVGALLNRIPTEWYVAMIVGSLAFLGHWWLASIIAALYSGFWIGRVVEVLDQIGRILDRTEER